MDNKKESYILPFLWMKGEDNETIKNEIARIYDCGVRELCLESRPHPDFCGPAWWESVDTVLAEAKKRRMRVWILDDDKFPTGHANGAFEEEHKDLAKVYLTQRHVDILGPCTEGSILVKPFLGSSDKLLAILACPKPDGETTDVSSEGIIDLTDSYKGGFVFFDLPKGPYRLFVIYTTRKGGGRPNYINLIDSASVRVLIDAVYEKHYAHYKEDFGDTIAGFFSDEPELGNTSGYSFHDTLGKGDMHLPWSEELAQELDAHLGGDYVYKLPALWYGFGADTGIIRQTYMECVTRLVARCFSGQIGAWCAAHHVDYIGHIIEDDNAHTRLGCSIGHYFREMSGQHMAGIDVVHHQIVPGFTQKVHQWIAGDKDGEFFHFGLAKLASSAAHIDENKKGRALVELFGNYGWAEGVSLMRWLVDHMLVRGINHFTPHAFSMTDHDKDCPPHFYALGQNPQYEVFGALMRYTNRMADLLYGGTDCIDAAVLYHAEAEWADPSAMLFQKPLRALMEAQIDGDVIPADALAKASVTDGRLVIGSQSYAAFILPSCRYLKREVIAFVINAKKKGLPTFIVDALPEGDDAHQALPPEFAGAVEKVPLDELAERLRSVCTTCLYPESCDKNLRTHLTKKDGAEILMLFNESTTDRICTGIRRSGRAYAHMYRMDVWHNVAYKEETGESFDIDLQPGESAVYLFSDRAEAEVFGLSVREDDIKLSAYTAVLRMRDTARTDLLTSGWQVYRLRPGEEEVFLEELPATDKLPNMNGPDRDIGFAGTYIYRATFAFTKKAGTTYALLVEQAGDTLEVILNGHSLGYMVRFPDRIDVTDALEDGENRIELRAATTLVWERRDGASTHLQTYATGLLRAPKILW